MGEEFISEELGEEARLINTWRKGTEFSEVQMTKLWMLRQAKAHNISLFGKNCIANVLEESTHNIYT